MTWLAGQIITAQRLLDNTPHQIDNGYAAITGNVPTSGFLTTETVYLTTGSMTLRAGRAYRITVSALAMGATVGNTARMFVKRTNTTGTALFDTQAVGFPNTGANFRQAYENIAVNFTGADITGVLVATIQQRSGSGGVSVSASATSPAYVRVEDVGDATQYPSATPIT